MDNVLLISKEILQDSMDFFPSAELYKDLRLVLLFLVGELEELGVRSRFNGSESLDIFPLRCQDAQVQQEHCG